MQSEPQYRDPELTIELRWIKGHPRERKAHVETGLLWTLSFLGAELPSSGPEPLSWHGDVVTVDLDAAGVPDAAKPAWRKLTTVLRASDEYRVMSAIDVGRFVTLTLCSSYHYYALVGAATTYDDFRSKHRFDAKRVAVVESGIAKGNRLVEIGVGTNVREMAFVAYEGTGSLMGGSFRQEEIETIDFMENGQLRFALYDLEGNLKAAATPALTTAGKPSKCLWCHEIRLQPPYKNVTDIEGYHSTEEFRRLIEGRMALLEGVRDELDSRVDFTELQAHSFAELLYLSFSEPSLTRLAAEWNLSAEEAQSLLAKETTHRNEEYPFLGDALYQRARIDELAPYVSIKVPSDVREYSSYEPDLLR
jgi:hypothetical protein